MYACMHWSPMPVIATYMMLNLPKGGNSEWPERRAPMKEQCAASPFQMASKWSLTVEGLLIIYPPAKGDTGQWWRQLQQLSSHKLDYDRVIRRKRRGFAWCLHQKLQVVFLPCGMRMSEEYTRPYLVLYVPIILNLVYPMMAEIRSGGALSLYLPTRFGYFHFLFTFNLGFNRPFNFLIKLKEIACSNH